MKMIIITTYDDIKNPHYAGGGALAVHKIAKNLNKNHSITIVSWNHSNLTKEVIEGVKYERFGISFINPKVGMFLYQIFLPFYLLSKKCDLIIESFGPPFTTSILPFFMNRKVIGIVHMLAAEDMERKYKLPIFGIIEHFGIRQYKNLITTSEYMKKKVKKISPKSKIAVISNGIEKTSIEKTKKKNQILFLGRIEVNQKGLDILVEAFSKAKSSKQTKLIIAGAGMKNEMQELGELIKKSKFKTRIILKGKVEGKEKGRLLKESLCIVIPSRFETYSMVALEAMAHGLPIVCFDIDGLKWISSKAALKVKGFDVEKLSKTIEKALSNKDLLAKMSKEGHKYASGFTWNNVSKDYEAYLETI